MCIRADTSGEHLSNAAVTPPLIWTAMAWVRISVDLNAFSTFFAIRHSTAAGYACQTNSDGTTISIYVSGSNVNGSALTVGQWYHVAMTGAIGSVGDECILYLNGNVDATRAGAAAGTFTAVNLLDRTAAGGDRLNGCMAAFKMWEFKLTQAQVQAEIPYWNPVEQRGINRWATLRHPGDFHDRSYYQRNFVAAGTLTAEDDPPGLRWYRPRLVLAKAVAAAPAGNARRAMFHYRRRRVG